ncbi:phage tail tape measure protein [Acerihabitans arboris]|uniref:Phage tail tape measure protein n=1 Tax=Acerihabitans arboris TaxID=2691583 RepID=A0A845SPH4_9GAMM|nr:phage tail tape measure protein [Acerihabitans arboris]NDL64836.1 phage tail tape measure protein [Acerihabitans arboris]
MKQLDLTLSLIDKMTRPLKQAQGSIQGFANKSRQAFSQVVVGGAALWGVAQSFMSVVGPADEMQRALGQVRSLSVSEEALNSLSDTAVRFSVKYGESAADFVQSAYSIQGAIDGLSGQELSAFTTAGAILAKGTKADADTITNYMGTMYGIFRKTADSMGRSDWVKMMTGQTAEAVKIFKSDGKQMSDAFTAIGANATAAGVGMSEQFAVLGSLQATMSGSEAGTKYKAFLAGVGTAQKTLGLNFTNKDGTMKGIVDIMSLIQKKYGDISKVADSDLLKKAFGSDEAVSMIKLLATDVGGLAKNITALGKINGMENAEKMAKDMTNLFDRMLAVWKGIRIAIGSALLPAMNPLIDKIVEMGARVVEWLLMFKNIARWIGYVSMGVLSFVAICGLANIVVGVARFLWLGFMIVMKGLRLILLAVRFAMILTAAATWLLTSPLMLIIAVVAGLAYGVYWLIANWKTWTAAIANTDAWKSLMSVIADVGAFFAGLWNSITLGWQMVVAYFSGLSPLAAFEGFGDTIKGVFTGLWDYLKSSFDSTYNWIIENLNKIPGVNLELRGQAPAAGNLLTGGTPQSIGQGGVLGAVNNSTSTTTGGKTQQIGKIEINTAAFPSPQQLQEYQELYGQ